MLAFHDGANRLAMAFRDGENFRLKVRLMKSFNNLLRRLSVILEAIILPSFV